MSQAKFSCKEVISHGWAMTKKYLKTIFILAVICVVFNALSGVLDDRKGSDTIARYELTEVYKDRTQADRLYQYLQEDGYIDEKGRIQEKLQRISAPADVVLPPDLAAKHAEIYTLLNHHRYRLPFPKPLFYFLSLFLWAVNTVISIGLIKAFLLISRDQEPAIDELFSNWRFFVPYILGSICYGLACLGGFILLIIPGIIFMIMFQMYPYLIIDKGLGPIASLKRSRVITKGSRWKLTMLGLLLFLLNIGGLLCLVIGLFFTISITYIAMAYVYDRLENDSTTIAA